jgi:glycosyltransferase involved in cell wall biosynthesis
MLRASVRPAAPFERRQVAARLACAVDRLALSAGRRPPQICLVSREVFPLTGGGIGSYVTALAAVLRDIAQVRIITTDAWQPGWRALVAANDPRLPEGVAWTFVPEPSMAEAADWFGFHHLWSARVLEAIVAEYGSWGPDFVEFPDYQAEGLVTAQAKRAGHRSLRRTRVAIRAHTSWEMCRTLDGWVGSGREERSIPTLERLALKLADTLLWAGGDVLGTYRRFYGATQLPPDMRIRHPLTFAPPQERDERHWEVGYPLRLLYIGRLERRKGVQDLLRALARNDSDAWSLTLVGSDTDTAPLGVSQRMQLEVMALGDERVRFLDAVPRDALIELIRQHHVLVMPSRWECWPTVVLEAMALNRPVLATPTGGMLEMVERGRSGWLTRAVSPEALSESLDPLIVDLKQTERLIQAGSPRDVGRELTRDADVRDAYAELIERPAPPTRVPRARRSPRAQPLVSIVIPYFHMGGFLGATLASVAEQTHPLIETIVVNDGSRARADAEVLEAAERSGSVRTLTQTNRGLGAARNAGIVQSRGRYVVPLDADNVIEPTFVERCLELLEADPALAYVTCWSHYIDENGARLAWPESGAPRGYQPLGNDTAWVETINTAGDALAMLPRRLFDLGFRYSLDVPIAEDWMLYRALRRAGRYGAVIPERLVGYRVRSDSMYQAGGYASLIRVQEEATAQLDEEAIAWTP